MNILALYRRIVPEKVREYGNVKVQALLRSYRNRRLMERKNYGKLNKDKTFYVIRTDNTQHWGVFSTCRFVLANIQYAVKRNWIPVVDYQNYYLNGLQEEGKAGKENAWEYYFEPLDSRYSLEEVYQSRYVVLGPLRGQPIQKSSNDIIETPEIFDLMRKYIHIKPEIIAHAETLRKQWPSDGKILGVGIRAGMKWGETEGKEAWARHPKGPDIDEYIEKTEKYMKEFNCSYIFVSCDEEYYFGKMKEKFGERCLYVDRKRTTYFVDNVPLPIEEVREGEHNAVFRAVPIIEKNRAYIVEIYLLSKCDSLFTAMGGGGQAAILLNDRKYEHCVVWNNHETI